MNEFITVNMHENLKADFEFWLEMRGLYLGGPVALDDDSSLEYFVWPKKVS